MKMWTVKIRDQNARSVQFDTDLYCLQKLLVSSSVRKKLKRGSMHLQYKKNQPQVREGPAQPAD